MAVVSVEKDLDNNTLIMISEFTAPVERVWQVWADPRQLERWWGPPEFPATVTEHSLAPGARVAYYMSGPDGEKYHGWWEITSTDEPHALEFRDGFGDKDGKPAEGLPVSTTSVQLSEHEGGTRMVSTTSYASAQEFQQVLEMGMVEGATDAANQIDGILAA